MPEESSSVSSITNFEINPSSILDDQDQRQYSFDGQLNHSSDNQSKNISTSKIKYCPFLVVDEDEYEKNIMSNLNKQIKQDLIKTTNNQLVKLSNVISRCDEILENSSPSTKKHAEALSRKFIAFGQRQSLLSSSTFSFVENEEEIDIDNDTSNRDFCEKTEAISKNLHHLDESVCPKINFKKRFVSSEHNLGESQIFNKESDPNKVVSAYDEKISLCDEDGNYKTSLTEEDGLEFSVEDDLDDDVYAERVIGYNSSIHLSDIEANDVLVEGTSWSIPSFIAGKLFPYQLEGNSENIILGTKWLLRRFQEGSGGILADEMGLGKTVQAIASIAAITSYEKSSLGILIVAPATLIPQWVVECHRWYPPLRVIALHRSLGSKFKGKRFFSSENVLIITSYAMLLQMKNITTRRWSMVILDEGHRIRNPDAEISIVLRGIQASRRVLISGTPIQNSLTDLWSIVDWVHPGLLGTLHAFGVSFETPIRLGSYAHAGPLQTATAYKCATLLKELVAPILLRRWKRQVATELPAKTEQIVFCNLDYDQKLLYQAFLNSPIIEAIRGRQYNPLYGIDILRKICNAPELLLPKHSSFGMKKMPNPPFKCPNWITGEQMERIPNISTGKLLVLQRILNDWNHENHRALIFCQTQQMLNIFERFVRDSGYTYLRLDGSTEATRRLPLVTRFNKDRTVFLFLLTTRVGGLGLNLTGADRVVIYDPDWNPSTDLQARERVWRLGQTKEVQIFRLITKGTIEEKIYRRQIFKTMVTNRILRDPRKLRLFKNSELHDLFTLEDEINDVEIEQNEKDGNPSEDSILGLLLETTGLKQPDYAISRKTILMEEATRIAESSLKQLEESKSHTAGGSILQNLRRIKSNSGSSPHPLAFQLKTFLLENGGSAGTDAILSYFETRINKDEKYLFKSLLYRLADKTKANGMIIWTLKDL